MRRPSPLVIAATFALLVLIWGTTWAAIRISLEGFPPFKGLAARFAIAALLLIALMRLFGVRLAGTANERRIWLVNATLSFGASYGIVYWSEQYVPTGLASILFAVFPLLVALLAHRALPGERLTAGKVAGILTGFAGIALIFSQDFARLGGRQVAVASVVMLGAPLVSAISNVCAKRWGSGVHPLSMTAVPMAFAAVGMGLLGLLFERDRPVVLSAGPVAALLYLALFGSAVTFSLYYWLLSHMPATRLALIAYGTPVVAVLVGIVFMHEPLTTRTILGGLLVIGGVAGAMGAGRLRAGEAGPHGGARPTGGKV